MTNNKPIALAFLLAALVPTTGFAQEKLPSDRTAPQTDNGDGGKYVGNSGRLAPNQGVERKPTSADRTEHSADDPALNAGIYAVPEGHKKPAR